MSCNQGGEYNVFNPHSDRWGGKVYKCDYSKKSLFVTMRYTYLHMSVIYVSVSLQMEKEDNVLRL